jgi:hypothetical protein
VTPFVVSQVLEEPYMLTQDHLTADDRLLAIASELVTRSKKLKSVDASGWPVRTIHSFHDTATVSTGGKF